MMVHSKKVVQRKRKAFALFAGAKAFSVVFVWAFCNRKCTAFRPKGRKNKEDEI